MVSILILGISLGALAQFFVFYCRSIVLAYSQVDISDRALSSAGLPQARLTGEEFGRLMGLVRMCPMNAGDRTDLFLTRVYYGLATLARPLGRLAPNVAAWAEAQRIGCAHVVAVAFDRRVALLRTVA